MPVTTWSARSYSATLTPLFGATPYPLTLLSSHPQACNLATPTGTLIALICPTYGNGPFHVVVPMPRLPHVCSSTTIDYQPGTIILDQLTIELAHAPIWPPQLPFLQIPLDVAQLSLHEYSSFSALRSGPAAQITRAQQGIATLKRGIQARKLADVTAGVMALAGLGPGLTPAGDDFLVGLLAALHATAQVGQGQDQQRLCQLIATTAATQTTRLSAAWLQHAGAGHFSQRWHDLILALNGGISAQVRQAVTQIKATGATSGGDGLFGFVTGLDWLVRYCCR